MFFQDWCQKMTCIHWNMTDTTKTFFFFLKSEKSLVWRLRLVDASSRWRCATVEGTSRLFPALCCVRCPWLSFRHSDLCDIDLTRFTRRTRCFKRRPGPAGLEPVCPAAEELTGGGRPPTQRCACTKVPVQKDWHLQHHAFISDFAAAREVQPFWYFDASRAEVRAGASVFLIFWCNVLLPDWSLNTSGIGRFLTPSWPWQKRPWLWLEKFTSPVYSFNWWCKLGRRRKPFFRVAFCCRERESPSAVADVNWKCNTRMCLLRHPIHANERSHLPCPCVRFIGCLKWRWKKLCYNCFYLKHFISKQISSASKIVFFLSFVFVPLRHRPFTTVFL